MSSRKRTPSPEWAAIDVDLLTDPKIVGLTTAERLAYVASILWTTKHLTDGHVPTAALGVCGVTRKQAQKFVTLHLWEHDEDGGYVLTAWHKWQKPRAEWLRLLENRRHAGALAACQRWHEEWCRCLTGEIPIKKRT